MELDIAKIIELTENNQVEEATRLMNDYFDSVPRSERGKVYVSLASLYMQMEAKNNKQMAAILAAQLQQLKELDKAEQEIMDKADLEITRKTLE